MLPGEYFKFTLSLETPGTGIMIDLAQIHGQLLELSLDEECKLLSNQAIKSDLVVNGAKLICPVLYVFVLSLLKLYHFYSIAV